MLKMKTDIKIKMMEVMSKIQQKMSKKLQFLVKQK